MLLLKWKEIALNLKNQHKELKIQYFGESKKFVAALFFGENNPSQVYVHLKKEYAQEIWIDFLVFGQGNCNSWDEYIDLESWQIKSDYTKDEVIDLIKLLNEDERCIWMICQLPLTEELKPYQQEICDTISPIKDMDWLWKNLQTWAFDGKIDFLPATAQAVITLLNSYNFWNFEWKTISVIGQSEIVWHPISIYLQLHGADVHTFDISNTPEEIMSQTKESDMIISCTWALHMVDDKFVNEKGNQILIDVGYGFLNWKSTGDVNFEKIENKVCAISPVPGGVWPLTVASLFGNIFTILNQRGTIEKLSRDK